MQKEKVVFILGPTAVGKSEIAIKLAKALGGEIISADSVQIFKGLDIGSAKIEKTQMRGVVHHGIDICEPDEEFSAFEFVEFTKKKIHQIALRGALPIVVGGTGLYVKALVCGYDFGGAEKNLPLRAELERVFSERGAAGLFEILQHLAPDVAEKIDKNNPVRLIRAIEIAKCGGIKSQKQTDLDALVFALEKPRDVLYNLINSRTDKMLESGLVEEVKALKARGLTQKNQSMRAIGYKEVLQFLDGEITEKEMAELIKQHSRNYAKRQLTFLRSMDGVIFVDASQSEAAFEEIKNKTKEFLK